MCVCVCVVGACHHFAVCSVASTHRQHLPVAIGETWASHFTCTAQDCINGSSSSSVSALKLQTRSFHLSPSSQSTLLTSRLCFCLLICVCLCLCVCFITAHADAGCTGTRETAAVWVMRLIIYRVVIFATIVHLIFIYLLTYFLSLAHKKAKSGK